MLDPLFHEAWVHAPGGHTVLGRLLHPFCALDVLALEAIDSPFLKEGGMAEVPDLLLVVWICSHPPAPSCNIEHLELGDEGKKWIESIKGDLNMPRDVKRVQAYIADYYSIPEMMRDAEEETVTPYGCPWLLSYIIQAARNLHIPLFEAWTMPIGQLMWYCCAIEELTAGSDSRIVGDELRKEMKKAATAISTFPIKEGESVADLAKRCGIPDSQAAELIEQAATNSSQT